MTGMTHRTFIRGIGLVCAQGNNALEAWDALLAGRVLAGNIGATLDADGSDRVSQLAINAARQAVHDSGWSDRELGSARTALIVGSSKGPIERWLAEIAGQQPVKPLIGVGEVAADVGTALGTHRGPRLTLAAACASGLHALIRARLLLESGQCDRAIVVGAESSLHPIFQATFARLGVLAKDACRPFDRHRTGFLISEAAAAVCLEQAATGEVYVDQTCFASDPFHLTGSDPSGEPLRHVLSGICPTGMVDLVHAHGTGTVVNDPIELAAIQETTGRSHPAIYSHKAALGHTQGASGMIGVVLNVASHRTGRVLPNANTVDPLPHGSLNLSNQALTRPIRRSLVLAAGFGGAVAGVSLAS